MDQFGELGDAKTRETVSHPEWCPHPRGTSTCEHEYRIVLNTIYSFHTAQTSRNNYSMSFKNHQKMHLGNYMSVGAPLQEFKSEPINSYWGKTCSYCWKSFTWLFRFPDRVHTGVIHTPVLNWTCSVLSLSQSFGWTLSNTSI